MRIAIRDRLACAGLVCLLGAFLTPPARTDASGFPGILRVGMAANPAVTPRVVRDGAGGVFVAWWEQNGGNREAYVQHFNPDGSIAAGWPSRGVLTIPGGGDHLSILADGSGGVFVANDSGTLYGGVGLHHIDARGVASIVWVSPESAESWRTPAPGSSPALKFDTGNAYPTMVPDGEGGVLLAWQYSTQLFGNRIYVQRFTATNTVHSVWPSNLEVTYFWSVGYPVMVPDGEGGGFVSWTDGYPTAWVVVNRVTRDGILAPGWPSGGIRVCSDTHNQFPPGGTASANGAILAWADARDTTHEQVFAQRVESDGTLGCSPDGMRVCSQPTAFGPNRFGFYEGVNGRAGSIVADGKGGALVTWVDHRSDATCSADVFAQRIRADGSIAPGWPVNGAAVSTALGDQLVPAIVADGQGGAIVAWQDRRPGFPTTLRWIRLDDQGRITGDEPADGTVISATPDLAQEPVLCGDDATGAFVAWVDDGDPVPQVHLAHLVTDHIVPTLVSFVEAWAEPGRAVLRWFVDEPGFSAVVERRGAGAWEDRGFVQADGTGRIQFEDHDVTPGANYAYRLRVGTGANATWTSEARVTIPQSRAFDLAISNPVSGEPMTSISLPSSDPAMLDLLDVSGRLLARRDVGALGPGTRMAPAANGVSLSTGVYLLRLRQGTLSLSRRVVVVR